MDQQRYVDVPLAAGGVLRVEPVAPHTFRVRLRADGRFPEPSLVRYGILRAQWPAVEFAVEEQAAGVLVRTAEAELRVDREGGRIALCDAAGAPLTADAVPPWSGPDVGFGTELTLRDGERLYGLGDVSRERIEKRGFRTRMWVTNVRSYVPIPFLMSDRGWGLFLNTTWKHAFDVGSAQPDRLRFWGPQGELDYYLVVGRDLPTLLDRYTDVTGKPRVLPLWAYGLTFVCNQQANAREMLDDCLNFRREGIPCDVIGLEPGWMSKYYDYSVEKAWHPERFAIPSWSQKGPHTFLGAAERLGFKMSLWLCCDFDLSHEEERRAQAPPAPPPWGESTGPGAPTPPRVGGPGGPPHPDDFEQDAHFGHGPTRMDKITRPNEPWFQHLRAFVDQGASAFKMDGALQVNEHPDRKWGNGMDDQEMHNLYPTLLNKQMHLGFQEHTGRRSMVYSSGGYTGIQQFSATWAGDTGGGPKPLVSMLNHGLSGHVNTSCDMDVFTPEGIHFGFFQPWSQVCSWAYWRHPWLLGDKLLPTFRDYARLRYRLLPYIYSMAHVAARTGMPIMRAMSLAYPDDRQCDERIHQYLFGDAFLVGAFTDRVYLPNGRWVDYWTGRAFQGREDVTCSVPENRGGPLFVRAGAIIPTWPEMDYVGQRPVEHLGLDVYPEGESAFTLYEDDGTTPAYLEGAVAETRITCRAKVGEVELTLAPRQGEYAGMPERRSFDLALHVPAAPARALVDGEALSEGDAGWRFADGAVRLRVTEDPARALARVVRCLW